MQTIKLYLNKYLKKEDYFTSDWNNSPIFKTIAIDDNKEIWNVPLKINNQYYCICSKQDNNISIKEMEYYKENEDAEDLEEYCDDHIKCPVCGYEEDDCHEYSSDEEDEHECQHCGSILSWNREYTVTYTTEVKEINKSVIVK